MLVLYMRERYETLGHHHYSYLSSKYLQRKWGMKLKSVRITIFKTRLTYHML